MKNIACSLILASLLLSTGIFGCDDSGVVPPILPSVLSFTVSPRTILEGEVARFSVIAAADIGLSRGILDYGDGSKREILPLSGRRDSAQTSHMYPLSGSYTPTLTLEDVLGNRVVASYSLLVRSNQLPIIISQLTGTEGLVSRIATKSLAYDQEGDSLTTSVSPLSTGLIFQMNARGDSVVYYLRDQNDNGTKQARVTVVDQKKRTVEKVITIVFSPLDDISGRVHDRFEGTHLAGYRPEAVMQAPVTGWVEAITGGKTVRVSVSAGGNYVLPKLASANHTLRAFITNGRDSSYVATVQVSPGDQTFDFKVETNAGTGMPLRRLLSLYQVANFRTLDSNPLNSCLVGINLRNGASNYIYYLLGKDTLLFGLNTKRFTPEQQNWLESEIQTRCFAHLPLANRPRIVKGGPSDPVPVTSTSIPEFIKPFDGYMVLYADPQQVSDGRIVLWDERQDGLYDCARIGLKGGDVAVPPYGFSMVALVQKIGASVSGSGTVQDPYYRDRSIRAENTLLDRPSVADMKLDWQVVFETPLYNNNVEAKYFGMPQ